jgi:Ca2+-transporting ATPase
LKIIKIRLAAVETLGSATVICTDKTGTLTENRMTVQEYQLANARVVGISADNNSTGEIGTLPDENLLKLLRVSVLCNEATLDSSSENGQTQAIGDPTETALLVSAEKFEFDIANEKSGYKKLRELSFDSTTKRMIAVLQDKNEQNCAVVKGAPGVILEICETYITDEGKTIALDDKKRGEFRRINEEMADRALRVLAFADKNFSQETDFDSPEKLESGYTFLGFVGMIDPLRIGVAEAVKKAQTAGIRVVMLTGDQINTARAIARELNLNEGGEIYALHSRDLTASGDGQIAEMARRTQVFARVSPEDKLRIVRELQKAGEIVAVTGDGVNDAPALKQSDIGVAMGGRGTEVAKEAMLSRKFMFLILRQGVMLGIISLGAYLWALGEYGEGAHARTIALLAVVGVQLGHFFNCRSRTRSAFRGFFSNLYCSSRRQSSLLFRCLHFISRRSFGFSTQLHRIILTL